MIDRAHPLPVARQARLLGLSRSSVYYEPVPTSAADLALMAAMDAIHMELPFYGIRRIRGELRDRGLAVGRQHVATLMRTMGIEALHPKRRLSKPQPGHKIYPYLLRDMDVTAAGQVWCSDITYLPMARGFCYLVAVMDWASRRVLSWRLSNTLRRLLLRRGTRGGAGAPWGAADLQHRSGLTVHSGRLHGRPAVPRRGDQHGRTRPLDGQRLHRTSLEKRQVRGGVSEGLRERVGGAPGAGSLL